MKTSIYEHLSFFPLLRHLQRYRLRSFRSDLYAAITIALMALPQSMAYALIADLPPSLGLFSAVFATIFGAAFGSSRYLVIGATNTVSILILAGTNEILYTYYRDVDIVAREALAVQVAIELALMVGLLQIIAAVFRLGRLAQYVSRPVVIGYILGAALTIVIDQLFNFFGVSKLEGLHSIYEQCIYLLTHFSATHYPTLFIGVASLAFLLITKRLHWRFPASVLMLIFASLVVYFLNLSPSEVSMEGAQGLQKVVLLSDFGNLQSMIPHLEPPFFDLRIINALLPIAFAIALLGMLEVTSIVKTLASQSGGNISLNQEILGLGIGNFVGSWLGAMPSSGSFSRSAMNYNSGAKTHFSAIMSGIFVAAFLFFLGSLVTHIPLTALSALLLVTAFAMVERHQLRLCLRATRSDAVVLIMTFAACIVFNLETAFYIGVVLSIALYLKKAAMPTLVEYTLDLEGTPRQLRVNEEPRHKEIRIIDVQGELFFAAVDFLQATLKAIASKDHIRVIILRLKHAQHLDASACLALQHLHQYLTKTGRYLILSGLKQQVWQVLERSRLLEELGRENVFSSGAVEGIGATQRAFERAEELLHPPYTPSKPVKAPHRSSKYAH